MSDFMRKVKEQGLRLPTFSRVCGFLFFAACGTFEPERQCPRRGQGHVADLGNYMAFAS
jgi:hypothetical protein